MKMHRGRLMACALTLGSTVSLASLAQAQSQSPTNLPPVRTPLDGNSVNLATGVFEVSPSDLIIGMRGAAGLAHARSWTGNGWIDSFAMTVTTTSNGVMVSIGDQSSTFTLSGSTYTSDQGNGATLTATASAFTYTATDGTVIVFDRSYAPYSYGWNTIAALATSVTAPGGSKVTLTYKTYVDNIPIVGGGYLTYKWVRLQSVNDAYGYQLKYTYQQNDTTQFVYARVITSIAAINNAVDYCDPTADTCSALTQSWPTVSYASATVGSNIQQTVTDPLGRATRYTFNSNSQLIGIKRPSSSTDNVTVAYDSNGRVQNVTRDGQSWTYAFTLSGSTLTATITDPLSHQWVTTANASLVALLSEKDPNGHTTTYTPDGNGRITKIAYPEGNYVQYGYDARGNVTSTTAVSKTPGTPANIVTSANYDTTCTSIVKCNQPNWTKDALGNETDYTYDTTTGKILTVTQPAPTTGGVRPQTRYSYTPMQAYYKNSAGSIVASGISVYQLTGISACRTTASCTGALDESKTIIGFGPQVAGTANNLLPVSSTSSAGDGSLTATSSATYDIFGNVSTMTDPLSNMTAYFFDADHEPLGSIGPDPDGAGALKMRATRLTYNADGLVTLAEQGTATANTLTAFNAMTTLQQVANAYDSTDRKIQDSAQAGGTTYAVVQYSYDAASRLQCSAQRMNPSVFSSLPSSACTLGTTGSYGPDRITYNTYDNANQLLKVTSGYGVTTANGFPATLQRDETTYTYSNNGKVTTLADAKNNLTTYVYDGFDRLSQTQYPSPTTAGTSNTADYEQLGYDAASNVTSRRLRDGNSLTYGYDALNRMSSKTRLSTEPSVTYTYDNLGHPSKFKQGNSSLITFGFDALGRETSEAQPYGTMSYQYDLAGNRTRLTWGDGIYVTFDYDAAHEMTAVHENGGTVIASLTYDDLGRRATRTYGSGAVSTYNYDAISRLTSIALTGASNLNTTTLSNYSPAGEIGSKANSSDTYAWTLGANANRGYTTNGLNQYTAIAGSSVGYDAKGNVTSLSGLTYTYSSENLLTSINTSTPTNFYYDALNRLVELDDSTANVRFVYDGDNIVQEVFLNGTVARRYVPGPLPNETLVWYDGTGTGTKRYFDQDERGSTTRVSNQSGTSWSINSYDEYGTPGSSNSGRFEYTGYALMDGAGIYYAKARMYSPAIGRFLQTDPIGYGDGPNWYNYAGGNPVNRTDPNGTDIVVIGGFGDGFDFGFGFGDFDFGAPNINIPDLSSVLSSLNNVNCVGCNVANGKRKNGVDAGSSSTLSTIILSGPQYADSGQIKSDASQTPSDDSVEIVVNGHQTISSDDIQPIVVTGFPPAGTQLAAASPYTQQICRMGGYMCLESGPTGPDARRQCSDFENACEHLSRTLPPANDPEKFGGERICSFNVCIDFGPSGLPTQPYYRITPK